ASRENSTRAICPMRPCACSSARPTRRSRPNAARSWWRRARSRAETSRSPSIPAPRTTSTIPARSARASTPMPKPSATRCPRRCASSPNGCANSKTGGAFLPPPAYRSHDQLRSPELEHRSAVLIAAAAPVVAPAATPATVAPVVVVVARLGTQLDAALRLAADQHHEVGRLAGLLVRRLVRNDERRAGQHELGNLLADLFRNLDAVERSRRRGDVGRHRIGRAAGIVLRGLARTRAAPAVVVIVVVAAVARLLVAAIAVAAAADRNDVPAHVGVAGGI